MCASQCTIEAFADGGTCCPASSGTGTGGGTGETCSVGQARYGSKCGGTQAACGCSGATGVLDLANSDSTVCTRAANSEGAQEGSRPRPLALSIPTHFPLHLHAIT